MDIQEKDAKTAVYELGFNLIPDIGDEGVAKAFGDIKGTIEERGGSFISEEMPHSVTLSYEMEKVIANKKTRFGRAYFGWIKFEASGETVVTIKRAMDENPVMLRYLIIKTVRESTLAPKKILQKMESTGTRRDRREREEPKEPMNKEEVDREIDALVGSEEKAAV